MITQRIQPGFYAFGLSDGCMDLLKFDTGTPSVAQVSAHVYLNEEALVRVRRSISSNEWLFDCWLPKRLEANVSLEPITSLPPDFTVADMAGIRMATQLISKEKPK